MADIIHNKLGVQIGSAPVSGLTFIRLFYYIFRVSAVELGLQEFYDSAIVLSDLEQRMEILACDANCSSIRPSELALVAICTQMDASISKLEAGADQIHGLVDYAIQLQKLCRVSIQQEICFAIKMSSFLSKFNLKNIFSFYLCRSQTRHSSTLMNWSLKFSQIITVNRKCPTANVSYGNWVHEHSEVFDQPINWKFHHTCQQLKRIIIATMPIVIVLEACRQRTVLRRIGRHRQWSLFASSANYHHNLYTFQHIMTGKK